MSIIALTTRKRYSNPKNPEARATEALHSLFFGGAGPKFLGWGRADERLLPDGTWEKVGKDGWRFWSVPTEGDQRNWWNPVWDHLKGNHRGVVAYHAKGVPFVSVDLDRHTGEVPARDHIFRVLKAGRLLLRHFPELRWPVAEVNRGNGSAKFFGFTGRPIPIDRAVELGREVHSFLLAQGLGDLEVFPFNCGQVGLPMRVDKTTITGTGALDSCARKKKVDGSFVRFETYSAVAFLDAIKSRSPYSEDTLHRVLKAACANLPDRPVANAPVAETPAFMDPEAELEGVEPQRTLGDYTDEPNALTRQLRALLELARRLHRVPGEAEALSFLKENRLYSGDWSDHRSRRISRVRWILTHSAKTFDPAKCASAKYKVGFGKFDNWARAHVGTLREKVRRYVDEYGEIHERRGRAVVDWRFVSVMLSIVEFCFTHPNRDQSLPQLGARRIWESSYEAGLIAVRWDDRKWAIARDWLEEAGVIEVFDRKWRHGHGSGRAMKWRPTERFHDLHVWYKTKKQPSVNDPVSLADFLAGMQPPHPLNYYLDTNVLLAGFCSVEGRCRPPP